MDSQAEFYKPLGRTCAIVVGTSKPQKNWPADRYAQVIDAIEGKLGLRCVLVGGPSAIEREAADEITRLCRIKPLNALGDDVRRVVWLLDGASLVISPDTGPLHIARALDRPVVGLYGYTNPKRYGPYRKFQDLMVDVTPVLLASSIR
jgi:heptosyltransferase I